MSRHVYVITGTSRGLGEALATQLLAPDHQLFCVSRGNNEPLMSLAKEKNCPLQYDQLDLEDVKRAESWIRKIISKLDPAELSSITIVHNAGLLYPIKLIGKKSSAQEVQSSVTVNLTSPMRMTEAFVELTQRWAISKKVLMISSGAARRPIASWSTYCTTKAGIDMFARCLAEEQQHQDHPVQVVSLAPGVIDTFMQSHIRKQPKAVFPGVDRFLNLHEDKLLLSPEDAARNLIRVLQKDDFGTEVIADVRE